MFRSLLPLVALLCSVFWDRKLPSNFCPEVHLFSSLGYLEWFLVGVRLIISRNGSLCAVTCSATNGHFRIEAQTLHVGPLSWRHILDLPMSGSFNVSVTSSTTFIQQNFVVNVPSRPRLVGSSSFADCSSFSSGRQSCVFSNVLVSREAIVFSCERCVLLANFSLSVSFTGIRSLRTIVATPESYRKLDNQLAVYGDVGWHSSFYHFEHDAILPLFQLIHLHDALAGRKVLLVGSLPWQRDQLSCFGFQEIRIPGAQLVGYGRVIMGFPFVLEDLSPALRQHMCSGFLYENWLTWRLIHKNCFGGNKTGQGQRLFVFLNRPAETHRYLRNWQSLIAHLNATRNHYPEWSFVFADMKGWSFRDQYLLLSRADVLTGVHGAGFSHMLFMRPRSSVIEVAPYLFGNFYSFGPHAACLNLSHQLFSVSRNSSFPVSPNLRKQLEKKPDLFYRSFAHRKNIRDQVVVLSDSELTSLSELIFRSLQDLKRRGRSNGGVGQLTTN